MRRHVARLLLVLLLLGAVAAIGCTRKQPQITSTSESQAFIESMKQRQQDSEPVILVEEDEDLEVPGEPEQKLTAQEQAALASETELDFDLDVRETQEFHNYFSYFTHKKKQMFQAWLKRSEPYLPYVRKVFREQGLPDVLVLLPFAESGYNPWAYSRAHAAGLWQFIPGTGRKFGLKVDWWVDERRDPYKATLAAAQYLKQLHEMFDDWYLALAAYNAGEGKIARALRRSDTEDYFDLCEANHLLSYRVRLRPETKNYVPKFLAIVKIVANLESLGFEPLHWDQELDIQTIQAPPGADLHGLAEACGLTWKEFNKLNPHFRRTASPPYMETPIYVPRDKAKLAQAWLEKPDARPFAGYRNYKIRYGDSWWRISRRFGVPISVLKKVNGIRSNTLHPGKYVMIPDGGGSKAVRDTPPSHKRRLAQQRSNYIVHTGDTLWSISRSFGVSLNTLLEANGMTGRETIRAGQKIYIPDASTSETQLARKEAGKVNSRLVQYRVRSGDTLSQIAEKFGVSTSSLKRWNGRRTNRIYAGELLKVYLQ
jgi:membrane-bound lytic murein transglycosylase D